MEPNPEGLYLDLLKKTLSYTLWPEPPIPIETFDYYRPPFKSFLIKFLSGLLKHKRVRLVQERTFSDEEREEGRVWPGYAETMIGLRRLNNIQFCIETVLRENVPGDLIETGVWRGGACIFMRGVLAAYGIKNRRVFVADSFEGLPKPEADKYPSDKGDPHHTFLHLAVSQDQVEHNFKKYGFLDDRVVFLKGWFKDTLPNAPIEKLAILRLDGDMYSSTMVSLTNLYPKLSTGGYCIIDDYALPGCRQAVDDYRAQYKIQSEMQEIDWTGRYWRKST